MRAGKARERLTLTGFESVIFPHAAERAARREAERIEKSAPRMGSGLFRDVCFPERQRQIARHEARRHVAIEKAAPRYGEGLFTSVIYPREVDEAIGELARVVKARSSRSAADDTDGDEGAIDDDDPAAPSDGDPVVLGAAEERLFTLIEMATPSGPEDEALIESAAWEFADLMKREEPTEIVAIDEGGGEIRGVVVETYVVRSSDYVIDGTPVKQGSWLLGALWPDAAALEAVATGRARIRAFDLEGVEA